MSSKSKRFVSVFDRLGPGTDESVSGTGRRFSSEKTDKPSRLVYPLSPPEQLVTRERKLSHSEYEEKKHHYHEAGSRTRPHTTPLEHGQDEDEEERFERKKAKRHRKRSSKHHGSSSESQGSGSEGDSGREGSKRRKKDSESLRRSKHMPEDAKRRHHDSHYERKDKPDRLSASNTSSLEIKGRSHGKDSSTPHESGGHKRRKEENHNEQRYGDRKRKHENDLSLYEYKKSRLATESHGSPHRVRGEVEGRNVTEHKRRHEPSPRDQSRRHPRSHTPETTPTAKKPSDRLSPFNSKRSDKKGTTKEKKSSTDAEPESSIPESAKALDWDYLSSYTQRQTAKLDHSRPRSALQRFTPGALFAQVGVSLSLAGPDYYQAISAVSAHLQQEDPFDGAEFAAVGLGRLRAKRERDNVFKTGECRRALTTSDDVLIRRKLRKHNQSDFLPRLETPSNWETQHYSTAVALYQSMGRKSSGKPAYRVQDSLVGELLVAR